MAAVLTLMTSESRGGFVIYSTGFEAPTYTTGSLAGQDGWSQDFGSTAAVKVENSVAESGAQALMISASGQPDFTRGLHFNSYNPAGSLNNVVSLAVDINLSATGTPSSYRVAGFDSGGASLGELVIGPNGTLSLLTSSLTVSTSVTVTRGSWNQYDLLFNYGNRTIQLVYDGSLVATTAFAASSTNVFGAEALEVIPGGTGTDQAYFDNLSVTAIPAAVPEPSSLTLSMVALVGLGLFRLSRKRVPDEPASKK